MCAGVTTFNALRHSGATPGDLVAIQAIGGVGHLAVQFASRLGYRTVAIGRDKDAKDLATNWELRSIWILQSSTPQRNCSAWEGRRQLFQLPRAGRQCRLSSTDWV